MGVKVIKKNGFDTFIYKCDNCGKEKHEEEIVQVNNHFYCEKCIEKLEEDNEE